MVHDVNAGNMQWSENGIYSMYSMDGIVCSTTIRCDCDEN